MTSSLTKKPFYYQPPWNILFELHKLERVQPWGINLSFLLMSFLDEMSKLGEVDFRASGMVLDSSGKKHQAREISIDHLVLLKFSFLQP